MSERIQLAIGEVPPEYRPDWPEVELPSQPSDPQRNPGVTEDLASRQARQVEQPAESVEIDLTIGVGEDPGWHRARPPRRWKESREGSVRPGA